MIRNLDLATLPPVLSVAFTTSYGPAIPASVAFTLAGNDPADIRAWADALHAGVEEHAPHETAPGIWMGGADCEAEIEGLRIEVYQSWPLPEHDPVVLHGGTGLWPVPESAGTR